MRTIFQKVSAAMRHAGLKRTKILFLVLALLILPTLFMFTYQWENITERVSRLASHKPHTNLAHSKVASILRNTNFTGFRNGSKNLLHKPKFFQVNGNGSDSNSKQTSGLFLNKTVLPRNLTDRKMDMDRDELNTNGKIVKLQNGGTSKVTTTSGKTDLKSTTASPSSTIGPLNLKLSNSDSSNKTKVIQIGKASSNGKSRDTPNKDLPKVAMETDSNSVKLQKLETEEKILYREETKVNNNQDPETENAREATDQNTEVEAGNRSKVPSLDSSSNSSKDVQQSLYKSISDNKIHVSLNKSKSQKTKASQIVDRLGHTEAPPNNSSKSVLDSLAMRRPKLHNRVRNDLWMLGHMGGHRFSFRDKFLQKPSSPIKINGTVRPDTCERCFKVDFKRLINEETICSSTAEVDVLMLILTTATKLTARNAIRKTWGSVCTQPFSKFRCVFLLGTVSDAKLTSEIQKESETYHDIVQIDFKDSYTNLTYKTMTGLKWALDFCPKAKYIMKADDDMYVNTRLLPALIKDAPTVKFLGGFCWGQSAPHRDTSSKWHVPFHLYTGPSYPPMCSGTSYILTPDVAQGSLDQSKNIPFFYLEDVYLALCVHKLGIKPVKLAGFNNMLNDYSPCMYRNVYITSHGISPQTLESVWTEMAESCKSKPPSKK